MIRMKQPNAYYWEDPASMGFERGKPGEEYNMQEVLIYQERPNEHYMIRKALYKAKEKAFIPVDGDGMGKYASGVWGWKPVKKEARV